MAARHLPDRGDVIVIGGSPVLVVSPLAYNRAVGLALCCPIAESPKGYPFEVVLPPGLGLSGAVLADQVHSIDLQGHAGRPRLTLPLGTVGEVLGKLTALLAVCELESRP